MTTPDLAGEAMPFPDRQTVNVLLTILLFAVVLAVVYIARTVLIVFCFAILFAYLIGNQIGLARIPLIGTSVPGGSPRAGPSL